MYSSKLAPTYGTNLNMDPFAPLNGPQSGTRQYTPPSSTVLQQYPPPSSLPGSFGMQMQANVIPPQQYQQPVGVQLPANLIAPQQPIGIQPQNYQQPIVMVGQPSQPIIVNPQIPAESIEKTVKRTIKKEKEKEEKKKEEDKKPEFTVKGVKGGKRLDLYFTDGQTIRHKVSGQPPKMGVYMSEHNAIVCGNIRYISLKAFAEDHKDELGIDNRTHNAWAECEYKDGKNWKSTKTMESIEDEEYPEVF